MPEYWKERTNPIRRFYQAPLNGLWKALTPVLVSKRICLTIPLDEYINDPFLAGAPTSMGHPVLDGQGAAGWHGIVRRSLLL